MSVPPRVDRVVQVELEGPLLQRSTPVSAELCSLLSGAQLGLLGGSFSSCVRGSLVLLPSMAVLIQEQVF